MNPWLIVLFVVLGLVVLGLLIWLIVWLVSRPIDTKTDYNVEIVNETNQLLLLGAIGPTSVTPVENTWDLHPGQSLNINIPSSWLNTAGNSSLIGPRFWVRTGCRYNVATNKAQCETGDCSGPYNCSEYKLAGKIPTSLAEFCFECGGGLTYYDVSLVDGYSLSVNIEPLDGTPTNPNDPNDVFWCKTNLCNSGQDLRSICPLASRLMSSQLSSYIPGQPDNIIGCFSNCGFFEYPVAPSLNCDATTDPKCAGWRQYCCQAPDFGKPCNSDADCSNGAACWTGNNNPPSSTNPATCQCRAYYLNPPCPSNVCTNPDSQPSPSTCSQCAFPTSDNTTCTGCIGDDTVHSICPRAYSWPNDPQTYDCNAKRYRITISPGGTPVPITPSVPIIPKCSQLPPEFDYSKAKSYCSQVPATYACAVQTTTPNWACNVDPANVGCNGVLCAWDR